VGLFAFPGLKDQKIAAFGSSYAPVGAAEGCDLLILLFYRQKKGRFDPPTFFPYSLYSFSSS